jgi:hypothetical protein
MNDDNALAFTPAAIMKEGVRVPPPALNGELNPPGYEDPSSSPTAFISRSRWP